MNDSPDNRVERDPSQTSTSTPNNTSIGHLRFVFVLGSGLLLSQAGCSPTTISIVKSDGSHAAAANTAPKIRLPEGALELSIVADDGIPIGIMKRDGRILFCIGEELCEVRSIWRNGKCCSLDDQVLPDVSARDMIGDTGLAEDASLVVESALGSLSIDVKTQKAVAEQLRKAIVAMRLEGKTDDQITVNDVAYELHLNDTGNALHIGATLAGGDPPPKKGTCSLTVTILPKEAEQSGSAQ